MKVVTPFDFYNILDCYRIYKNKFREPIKDNIRTNALKECVNFIWEMELVEGHFPVYRDVLKHWTKVLERKYLSKSNIINTLLGLKEIYNTLLLNLYESGYAISAVKFPVNMIYKDTEYYDIIPAIYTDGKSVLPIFYAMDNIPKTRLIHIRYDIILLSQLTDIHIDSYILIDFGKYNQHYISRKYIRDMDSNALINELKSLLYAVNLDAFLPNIYKCHTCEFYNICRL